MKFNIIFLILISIDMYSQNILDKQNYSSWLSENKESNKQILLNSLSNEHYRFRFFISNNNINVIIEDLNNKTYSIFQNYNMFKSFYEAKNKFVFLPEKIENFFDDNEVLFYEISLKDRILRNDETILNELMNEFEITIAPKDLNKENISKLEEQFKDYRIQKEQYSKHRLLFSYYFIEYFISKIKSQKIVTSINNVLNQEVIVPNVQIEKNLIDIYSIVRSNEFLNRTISVRLLKDEIDSLIFEYSSISAKSPDFGKGK